MPTRLAPWTAGPVTLGIYREEVFRDGVNAVGGDDVAGERQAGAGRGVIGERIVDGVLAGEIAAKFGLGGVKAALNDAEMLAHPFVVGEDEELVFDDGRAEAIAELVALERLGFGREEVAGVEGVVAEEFVDAAVDLVGAGLGGDVDDAGGVAEFGLEEIALDLEFLDGVEGRVDGGVADARVAEFDAVEQVAGGAFALAADEDAAVGALGGGGDEAGRAFAGRDLGDDAGRERAEGEVIAAVQGKVFDGALGDQLAEGGGVGVGDFGVSADLDLL